MLNFISDVQLDTIKLWYLVQHSNLAFRNLETFFGSVHQAVSHTNLMRWAELSIHKNHVQRAQEFLTDQGQADFLTCLELIKQYCDFILLEHDPHYPQQLLPYSDHPPILFGQGIWQNLAQPQIAIVGSRKPSPHGKQVAYDFAYYLSEKGFFITSGSAEGIDAAAHTGALKNLRTIAVVGTGLEKIYPTQNRQLHAQILENSGTIISLYLPNTPPLKSNFPRRNRIVSALSLGVLVAEAAIESGSLITAQAAAEQGKIIFAIPGHIYSEHHQGCHQLIREGAILVDHPDQIVEDLALPTHWHYKNTEKSEEIEKSPELPEHLFLLYQHLDWVGQEIDILQQKSNIQIAELTGYLMELELLGLCIQQSGLYLRCRASH